MRETRLTLNTVAPPWGYQPRAMMLTLRMAASSAFSSWVNWRSCCRCPPL